MKNIRKSRLFVCVAAVAVMLMTLFAFAGCGKKALDEPVFAKALIYSDDMDVTTTYLCDDNWKKTVKSIRIPEADKNISCDVYGEVRDSYNGYIRSDIEWGIEFFEMSEDFTFTSLEITWDDGTVTTEDIGSVTVAAKSFDIESVETLNSDTEQTQVYVYVYNDMTVNLNDPASFPYREQLLGCYETIDVNGMPLAELFDGGKTEAEKDGQIEINAVPSEDGQQFDIIDVMLFFNGKAKEKGVEDQNFAVMLSSERGLEKLAE